MSRSGIVRRGLLAVGALAFTAALTAARPAQAKTPADDWYLATMNPSGDVTWLNTGAKSSISQAPLGSAWKLFVYAYMTDNNIADKPYACQAGHAARTDDEYCCSAAENIGRDVALARSCGPYFEPARLGISAQDWQNYWRKTAPQVAWLQQLSNLTPATKLPVSDILAAMNSVPKQSVVRSREALLQRLLQPSWSDVLENMGSGYRFKTYTWYHPSIMGAYFGGAAGWLADGRSFWLGGTGGSHAVLQKHAAQITQLLPPASQALDEGCVVVDYFARYPIAQVSVRGSGQAAPAGALRGTFAVKFANGQQLSVRSTGELNLQREGQNWRIVGRLGMEEYVARVLDREGDARHTQAARALAIAARSYLQKNGYYHQSCWQIADDSRYQRVSPNPASETARQVAAFTEGLTLTGSPIFYHQNQSADNTLNWQAAVDQWVTGTSFITQLRQAYPQASWQLSNQQQQCVVLDAAQNYLNNALPQARRMLAGVEGLERVDNLQICRLDYGNPYTDASSHRIYLRDWRGAQDKTSLWHEYLHLALRYHPSGQSEQQVEQLARDLMQQLSPVGASFTHSTTLKANTRPNKKIRRAQ